MRGCDAVSFVFGLEVTWSLIQQRQQEEEEAEAAKVLEEMQENGDLDRSTKDDDAKPAAVESEDEGEDDGSDDESKGELDGPTDDNEDCDPAAVESGDHNLLNATTGDTTNGPLKFAYFDSEESDGSEGRNDELATPMAKSVAMDSNPDEDVVATLDLDDTDEESSEPLDVVSGRQEASNDKSTSAKKTSVVLELSSDEDEDESCAADRISSKKTVKSATTDSLAFIAAPNAPPTPPNQWKCVACTFLNKMAARKCEVCFKFRPKRQSSVTI